MANPNIVNVSSIFGRTAVQNVTTAATAIVTNSVSSNIIQKINSLIVANVNGSTAADLTAEVFRSGIAYRIAFTVSVPADATLVVISKVTAVYLEEGDSLRLTASSNGFLQAVCSYEDIA